MWLLVHNVATGDPRQECVVLLIALILDLHESFLGLLELVSGATCDAIVPVEVIIINEVRSDRFEINKDIIELFQNEEATCHALSTWDRIALGG